MKRLHSPARSTQSNDTITSSDLIVFDACGDKNSSAELSTYKYARKDWHLATFAIGHFAYTFFCLTLVRYFNGILMYFHRNCSYRRVQDILTLLSHICDYKLI